jgi:hypothetical protein
VVSLVNVFSNVRIDLFIKSLRSLLLFLNLSLVSHALSCHLANLGGVRGTALFDWLGTPLKLLLDVLGHLRLRK